MDIIAKISQLLNVRVEQVEAAVTLIDEGNTIPFISRYRKEATGSLNDEQLRELNDHLSYLRALEDKKEQVIKSIEAQGKLDEELRNKIEQAKTQVAVEDLYRPYRPKRKTRASEAKARGLEPLAEWILAQKADEPVENEAAKYTTPEGAEIEKGLIVATAEDALKGAMDILAEKISDNAEYRTFIREKTCALGQIKTAEKAVKQEDLNEKEVGRRSVYEMYHDFQDQIKKVPGYRILAINRGENEGFLSVKVVAPVEDILAYLQKQLIASEKTPNPYTTPVLVEVVKDAYERLIAPAIEREIRAELTEKAEDGAITVFRANLSQLLMQPPITGKVVLGWDPAFRTGCKIAVVDPTGKMLETTVVYPTAPQNRVDEAKSTIKRLIAKHKVSLISLGNGTASRESEQVVVDIIREYASEHPREPKVQYIIVNEAGASVYSASKLATEEFPNLNVGERSSISMARRLQDPLAELVKIDPKAIGVGQYQHDMNQKKLGEALGGVVEDCVNKVGVDVNTASFSLLTYISGISSSLAKNIVAYREQNGKFTDRKELLKVAKLGPKAFEQCAGFLRINDGKEPLDATAVHPENYRAVKALLKECGLTDDPASFKEAIGCVKNKQQTAERLGIGQITLTDILNELEKPARDPREDMPKPILKSEVLSMEDLKPGMALKGTVRNIVDFGAFVDIGVHQDGLVHISRLSDRFVKHPMEVVKVGDIVDVIVVEVDEKKKRIALSMNGKM